MAADRQRALVGPQQGGEHPQQRALAGPVRPQHGQALAGRQLHVHPVDRPPLAEALHEAGRPHELAALYSVTSSTVKTRNTTASRPFDWAKATETRVVSRGPTIVFS